MANFYCLEKLVRKFNHVSFWLTLILIGLLMVPSNSVLAAFNQQINYQAKLTDSANTAVADANYSIVFSLYTTSTGGSAIWTETQTVTTTSGLLSVMLGSVSALTPNIFDQTLYLGVKVGTDAEMTPRKTIGTVPSAFSAYTLTGISTLTAGGLVFATTSSQWDILTLGSAGKVLKVVNGKLAWDTAL